MNTQYYKYNIEQTIGILQDVSQNIDYADRIIRAIAILRTTDGFKAQNVINHAITILLGQEKIKLLREEI